MNAKQRVSCVLGNGAFSYEGAQGTDYPEFSIRKISIYGGLKLCGDPTAPVEEITGLGIVTAERQFLQRPNVLAISRRTHARRKRREPPHLVSAWATRQRLVLGQEAVADKSK